MSFGSLTWCFAVVCCWFVSVVPSVLFVVIVHTIGVALIAGVTLRAVFRNSGIVCVEIQDPVMVVFSTVLYV